MTPAVLAQRGAVLILGVVAVLWLGPLEALSAPSPPTGARSSSSIGAVRVPSRARATPPDPVPEVLVDAVASSPGPHADEPPSRTQPPVRGAGGLLRAGVDPAATGERTVGANLVVVVPPHDTPPTSPPTSPPSTTGPGVPDESSTEGAGGAPFAPGASSPSGVVGTPGALPATGSSTALLRAALIGVTLIDLGICLMLHARRRRQEQGQAVPVRR